MSLNRLIFHIIHHVGPSHPSLSINERTEAACSPITSEQTYPWHSALTEATCSSETSVSPSALHNVLNLNSYHLAKFFVFLNLGTLTLKSVYQFLVSQLLSRNFMGTAMSQDKFSTFILRTFGIGCSVSLINIVRTRNIKLFGSAFSRISFLTL